MHIIDIYRVQADMILEFMESKGIKKEALNLITGPPAWSTSGIPRVAQTEHRTKVFKLYQEGVKQAEIARMTGRSQSGVSILLKRERERGNLEKRAYDARKVSDGMGVD